MKMSPICRHSGSIGEERKLPTRRIALQSEQTVSAGNERAVEEISAAVVACSGFKIHRILIQRRKKEDEGRRASRLLSSQPARSAQPRLGMPMQSRPDIGLLNLLFALHMI
jgi:hypothetical protein